MAKVSVCMATYNGEKFIEQQIASILKQISLDDELIISDDHSTDLTVKIIKSMNDPRIKLVYNNATRGYSRNFENAIRHASGDIIFLSDQDDVWADNKVENMVRMMNQAHLVVSDAQFVDQNLKIINKTFFGIRGARQGLFSNLYKQRYLGACMAFRREILPRLLPFPRRSDYCTHDLWITILCELYFTVAIINEPLVLYRRHGGNVSDGGEGSNNTLCRKLRIRIYVFFHALLKAVA